MLTPTRLKLLATFILGVVLTGIWYNTDGFTTLMPTAYANKALYPDRDWDRGAPSKLNISVFVFADKNRNGKYDVADKPLAGIAVRLTRPDGSTRIERSNINGYTNFGMHLNGDGADINQADVEYRFDVITPPEWIATTSNTGQQTVFKSIKGSIAGIGAETPPAPVGLAPPAEVRGSLGTAFAGATIVAESEHSAAVQATSDRAGRYALPLNPGDWTLRFNSASSETGTSWSREVKVAYSPVVLSALSAPANTSLTRTGVGERVVVGFDDLPRSFIDKLASGYAGLDWDYLLAVDNQFYKGPGYVNALISGANVAYNSSGHPVTISAGGGYFDFVGGYIAVAWPSAEGELLLVRAWRDDDLVLEDEVQLSHLAPIYYQADLHGISKLELESQHYTQFVADDLVFRR